MVQSEKGLEGVDKKQWAKDCREKYQNYDDTNNKTVVVTWTEKRRV